MLTTSKECLRDAGCSDVFIESYLACATQGDDETCLQLLKLHRCELVCALHEAQRPIDVVDWIIHDLEASHE